jgi:hypothetical protein
MATPEEAREIAEERIRGYIAAEARRSRWDTLPRYTLDLSYLRLTELPALPEKVDRLILHTNNLTRLPPLPHGLVFLDCGNNQLTELPELPPTLDVLYCYSNPITTLPHFPPSLGVLNCQGTQITQLPSLPPRMEKLFADNSDLRVIPKLPPQLTHLSLENCPLVEPYASLYRTYRERGGGWTNLWTLKQELNKLYTPKNQGRNVMSLVLSRPQPNVALPATTEALGMPNVLSGIASFFSGKKGNVKAQQLQLQEEASRVPGAPGVSAQTRKAGLPAGPIPNNNVPALVAEGGRRKRKTRKSKKARKSRKGRK